MTEIEHRILHRLALGPLTVGQLSVAVPSVTVEILAALEVRGLVARRALAWRLTDAGWELAG